MPLWRSGMVGTLASAATHGRRGSLPFGARVAGVALAVILLLAVASPWIEPHSPTELHVGPSLTQPSFSFPFGTDQLGRDVLSRVLSGARISLVIGVISVLLALVLAAFVGAVAAVAARWLSETIMRLLDIVMAFPGVIIAVCFIAVVQPGLLTTIGVIAFLYTPALSRVIRAGVIAQYRESYVDAARSAGARHARILVRHVAVNCAGPVLVLAGTMVADAIILESSLSFLGLGIRPPAPSWGNILSDGRSELFAGAWWISLFPGAAIFLCVLPLNILAEGFTRSLVSPRRVVETTDAPVVADTAPGAGAVESALDAPGKTGPDEAGSEDGLRVRQLSIRFPEVYGSMPVLSNVSCDIRSGEIVGMVGESGCGKSLVAFALMGLLPDGAKVTGSARLGDRELLTNPATSWHPSPDKRLAMIYQDALSALNPGLTVGRQLKQVCARGGTRTPVELFEMVGLPPAALRSYPHQLSGGQRQRALIAMALARSPQVLIADEPTTALDETIQAQVIDLLVGLRDEANLSILLVTHDLALANSIADRILVMYAGQLVEAGPAHAVTAQPRHPYTAGLLSAITSLEEAAVRLRPIAGTVPSPIHFPPGCRFADRCAHAESICRQDVPPLTRTADGRSYACHFPLAVTPAIRSASSSAGSE